MSSTNSVFSTKINENVPDQDESLLFNLVSEYSPAGDQEQAIKELIYGIKNNKMDQVLLGVTGSGKTFTIAHVIQAIGRSTMVIAPNKTLAAQLYGEMKNFFPNNAVEYFISYYDYYQPEAYIPRTDTFIEKESSVNEIIDRMRHATTRALLERKDVIIVSSVSCIYGIGAIDTYRNMVINLKVGEQVDYTSIVRKLIDLQYKRKRSQLKRGVFRVVGDRLEIHPAHLEDRAWRLSFFEDKLESIQELDSITGEINSTLNSIQIFANSHYVTQKSKLQQAVRLIKQELNIRLDELNKAGKILEAQRLEQRTIFDIEMIETTGSCSGIENYSRYLSGRNPGDPPPTLFEYLPKNSLLIVDESHITIPQISSMFKGDYARKYTLSECGFRLPSCMDNRPLRFEEWNEMRPQTIFVSATPGSWEMNQTGGLFTEQLVRPTGLIDPICEIRPTKSQVDDCIAECQDVAAKKHRVLITVLTKKMAEALTEYMKEVGIKVQYIHSDIDALDRIDIIRNLRRGIFDVLVGINLLREGLDIPECALVCVFDADKEGYLRSKTALVQTIGRAARNVEGRVLLYADKMTTSIKYALSETNRRRCRQNEYNTKHGITPESIKKNIDDILDSIYERGDRALVEINNKEEMFVNKPIQQIIQEMKSRMQEAVDNLEFEKAAHIRDRINRIQSVTKQ
ncbi:excinuclease ABC, B subunit [Candidatus Endolissoclinum faulkneri L5]|uniref:UvrABC system protein B n=1 Tax=Candidatus Endolissoclinum faulkneri L5 TaxID=1401328 RepID=V9TSQ3_9PROT|nr:excinuclease ABC, B subunit [Candidatus Endolissoclinum faulkneri L5]